MKKLFSLLLLNFPFSVFSQLIPLSEWDDPNRNWRVDISEVAYISTRCGCNFDLVGNYFVEKGTNDQHRNDGENTKLFANQYMSVALKASKITNMDEKAIVDRYKSFLNVYSNELAENKKIHNSIFMGLFLIDFQFCVKHFPFIKELDKKMQ